MEVNKKLSRHLSKGECQAELLRQPDDNVEDTILEDIIVTINSEVNSLRIAAECCNNTTTKLKTNMVVIMSKNFNNRRDNLSSDLALKSIKFA